ncbi:hypothetical protein GOODEAATRI_007477 [Goodea atripinnis]|uniref:Uncharacterized protein n=1 Tax=Goodea atripinnis TaxID=208336 RepID=A0ABV0PLR0_9TELE
MNTFNVVKGLDTTALNLPAVALAACLGSLSCWKVSLSLKSCTLGLYTFATVKSTVKFKHFLGKFQTFPAPNFGAIFISVRLFFIELYDHITRRSLCEGNLSTI